MRTSLVLLSARLLDPVTGRFLPETALAVSGGRTAALGGDREIRALADASTTVIDLKGAVVTPGLVDGHLHPVSGAELTHGLDLSGCTDLAGVREALVGEVRRLAPGAWLHAWGLDPNVFGDAPVESAALSPVLDGVPALLQLFDAHSMLASP
ncbi:amidohydrolase family protein, partial [Streptomyces sp. HCCB10043]